MASPLPLFRVFFSKKLVDVSGDPKERQWLHQCLSLAVAKENPGSILACVQLASLI